jgi:YfiR/HmsC-like
VEKVREIVSVKRSDGVHRFQFAPRGRAFWHTLVLSSGLRAVALVSVLVIVSSLFAQTSKPGEYAIKATYLYNFARYVEWPVRSAVNGDSFAICVLGQDPFGSSLDSALAGETIDGKNVVARRISAPQDAVTCRIVFISSSEDARLKGHLTALRKTDVLTVGDMPNFSQRGGMIQFVLDGNKVRFQVNLATAEEAGLTLSSELLKVAIAVRRTSQPGD